MWGSTGKQKTFYAIKYFHDKGIYELLLPAKLGGAVYWNGYNGEETVLIDEFNGQLSLQELNRICDGYNRRVNVKFGTTVTQHKRVIITSSKHPSHWWPIKAPWVANSLQQRLPTFQPWGELKRRVDEGGGFVWNVDDGEPPAPGPLLPPLPPPAPWVPPWVAPAVPMEVDGEERPEDVVAEEQRANAAVEWLSVNGDDYDADAERGRIMGDRPPSPEPRGMALC